MNQDIKNYQDCLKKHAYQPKEIIRISFNPKFDDANDLIFDDINNQFHVDKNKILNSRSFRRETDKTQAFFRLNNPHVRTRSSHTNEVVAIATTISRYLGLNTDLVEAAAYGHDIGHGPMGHLFEKVLQSFGVDFHHERFSAIVATSIEREGDGLNLTKETLMGMLEHSSGAGGSKVNPNSPNENRVLMYSDKLAGMFSDVNDFQRYGLLSDHDCRQIESLFPGIQRNRVNECIFALIKESAEKGYVSFEDSDVAKKFKELKNLLYTTKYSQINTTRRSDMLKIVYDAIANLPELKDYDPTIVTALMTNKEVYALDAIAEFEKIKLDDLKDFGVYESIIDGSLLGKKYNNLDLQLKQVLG